MKHIILTSILLFSTAVLAQKHRYLSDPDHWPSWKALDGGVEQDTTTVKPANKPIVGPQTDPDHWQGEYFWLDRHRNNPNHSNQNTQTRGRTIHSYKKAGEIKICIYGRDFMKITTPNGSQVFNYTLSDRIVTVDNTTIQLRVDTEGSWEAVDENQAYLFEEIECE